RLGNQIDGPPFAVRRRLDLESLRLGRMRSEAERLRPADDLHRSIRQRIIAAQNLPAEILKADVLCLGAAETGLRGAERQSLKDERSRFLLGTAGFQTVACRTAAYRTVGNGTPRWKAVKKSIAPAHSDLRLGHLEPQLRFIFSIDFVAVPSESDVPCLESVVEQRDLDHPR